MMLKYANELITRSQDLEQKLIRMLPASLKIANDLGFVQGAIKVIGRTIDRKIPPNNPAS